MDAVGKILEILAELESIHVRVDRLVGAAILGGSEGLRIPGLLVSHAAGQIYVNNALGDAFPSWVVFCCAFRFLLEESGQSQSEARSHADLHEAAPGYESAAMGGLTAFHRSSIDQ